MMLISGVSRPTPAAAPLRSLSSHNVPRLIEHLNFRATIAGALPCVTER